MTKTVLGIEGMACGMCEAHVNDAIRRAFPVKKVTANRRKKSCEIISEEPLDEAALREAVAATGYELTSIDVMQHKGLL